MYSACVSEQSVDGIDKVGKIPKNLFIGKDESE